MSVKRQIETQMLGLIFLFLFVLIESKAAAIYMYYYKETDWRENSAGVRYAPPLEHYLVRCYQSDI
jgi:hypothetical protein